MDLLRRAAAFVFCGVLLLGVGCVSPPRPPEEPITYLPAEEFARRLGLSIKQHTSAFVTMTDGRNTITVFPGPKGCMYLNGQQLGPPGPAVLENGRIRIMTARLALLEFELRSMPAPAVPPPVSPPRATGRITGTIVVDPGHGGKDPGARGSSPVYEKDIVLSIGEALRQRLAERGARVIITRAGDWFLELDERCAIAERARADLFISVHADSAHREGASGTTIYVAREAGSPSLAAARAIEGAFLRAGIECRGIQPANYRVLVGHSRPAVLIECGFLTNSSDVRLLNDASYRGKLAWAIAEGVADYFGR